MPVGAFECQLVVKEVHHFADELSLCLVARQIDDLIAEFGSLEGCCSRGRAHLRGKALASEEPILARRDADLAIFVCSPSSDVPIIPIYIVLASRATHQQLAYVSVSHALAKFLIIISVSSSW